MANKKEIIDKHVTRKKTSWLIRDVLQRDRARAGSNKADYITNALCAWLGIVSDIIFMSYIERG